MARSRRVSAVSAEGMQPEPQSGRVSAVSAEGMQPEPQSGRVSTVSAEGMQPEPQCMARDGDVLGRLQTAHIAVPYKYTGGSRGGLTPSGSKVSGSLVDCLTWCNVLWTSRVQILSEPEDLPVMVSYGTPVAGVSYDTVQRISPEHVSVVGKLGKGTSTRFEAIPESALVKLTYARFGAECQLMLAPAGDRQALAEARQQSGYSCCCLGCYSCCSRCCCPCLKITCACIPDFFHSKMSMGTKQGSPAA